MPHFETGYAETEALRRLMLGDYLGAEAILKNLTVGECNQLATWASTLHDLAYVPDWGDSDGED